MEKANASRTKVQGIGNYWSSQVAKKIYGSIDHYIFIKTRKHLKALHPNKPFRWIYKKYFKADYTGISKDKWILTDPHNARNQLFRMIWIPIVRHNPIKYRNSPDDASLKEYFEKRDKKEFIRNNVLSRQKLAKASNYVCRVCKKSLVGKESLKMNMIVPEEIGGVESYNNLELLHLSCQKQHQKLLEKYGEGKKLQKVIYYFEMKQVEPNSHEGYKLMKETFNKFKYQYV